LSIAAQQKARSRNSRWRAVDVAGRRSLFAYLAAPDTAANTLCAG
jgi:hypothetical protein